MDHFFRVFAQSDQSWLTRLGNLIFWCLAGDVLWRAATNQFGDGKEGAGRRRGDFRVLLPNSATKRPVSFESAMIRRSIPLRLVVSRVVSGVTCGQCVSGISRVAAIQTALQKRTNLPTKDNHFLYTK